MDRYRIVLADDHVLMRQGLGRIIGAVDDLEVIGEAGDGPELMSLLHTAAPHLVILDISMPNHRGIEAVREIKTKYPDLRILILTMHREYVRQALAAGVDGYLLKEDVDRDIIPAIENIRQGRVYLSPRQTAALARDPG